MLRNRFQQVVAVIGLGIGLWYVGSYVTSLGLPSTAFGWVAYAPLSHAVNVPGADLTSAEQTLVWVGLIAVWVGLSALVLKDRIASTPE
jgi:heme/copper-type cytochrome/quinol oxidase subunit 1